MKKLSIVLLSTMILAACTSDIYAGRGNATILSSKDLSKDTVELTVQKDDGEIVTLTRHYDAHAAVGARVNVSDVEGQSDLKTLTRYEFK